MYLFGPIFFTVSGGINGGIRTKLHSKNGGRHSTCILGVELIEYRLTGRIYGGRDIRKWR